MASRRAPTTSEPKSAPAGRAGRDDYWSLSTKPLSSFCLLAVFVAVFEAGSIFYLLGENVRQTIRARRLLDLFFANFGVAGIMATGLALLTVLLVWHVLSKERWRIVPSVLAGMLLEAALWALPIVVFGSIFMQAAVSLGLGAGTGLPACGPAEGEIGTLPWQARTTIAIGAGIYEEMLFRLIGIALIHFVVKDLLQGGEWTARSIAVVVTAAAFALYHDVSTLPPAEQWPRMIFYFAAGVYFGVLYLARGFGIVVAAHALYDVFVLVVINPRG